MRAAPPATLGQTYAIVRGETECYDCRPKQPPKTYPVCTIRSTPSLPIHCVVWAKEYLFAFVTLSRRPAHGFYRQLFGDRQSEDEEVPQVEGASGTEMQSLKTQQGSMNSLVRQRHTPDFGLTAFTQVFDTGRASSRGDGRALAHLQASDPSVVRNCLLGHRQPAPAPPPPLPPRLSH